MNFFKAKQNNTLISLSFESRKFRPINLALNVNVITF